MRFSLEESIRFFNSIGKSEDPVPAAGIGAAAAASEGGWSTTTRADADARWARKKTTAQAASATKYKSCTSKTTAIMLSNTPAIFSSCTPGPCRKQSATDARKRARNAMARALCEGLRIARKKNSEKNLKTRNQEIYTWD